MIILATLSILWVPMVPLLGPSLFIVVQKPAVYTAGPILACFLWGMLSSVPSSRGAFITLCVGMLFGGTRFFFEVIEVLLPPEAADFGAFTGLNFLNFGAINFVISTVCLFITSRLLPDSTAVSSANGKQNLQFYLGLSSHLLFKQRR